VLSSLQILLLFTKGIAMSQPDTRSVRQIETEIEANRAQLAHTIDELVTRTKPANLIAQQKRQAAAALQEFTYDENGQLRVQRLALVGAGVAALLALAIVRRRR
jgi:uncharacterized protein DUF3618